MARRREEIRVAVLEEKARVERAGENVEEVWRKKHRHYRAAARAEERESGGEERKARGWQRRAPVLTCRDGTESDSRPHLLPQTEQ